MNGFRREYERQCECSDGRWSMCIMLLYIYPLILWVIMVFDCFYVVAYAGIVEFFFSFSVFVFKLFTHSRNQTDRPGWLSHFSFLLFFFWNFAFKVLQLSSSLKSYHLPYACLQVVQSFIPIQSTFNKKVSSSAFLFKPLILVM